MNKLRSLILTILFSITYILSSAQMDTPDFAYPQTVAKNADKDLKTAVKNRDAHSALNALIRMYVANDMIDPDTRQKSIETATATADKFADSPLHGMFDALLARLYFDFYQDQAWTYDRRQLPLTPLPKQISEWSGDQFKNKIRQLCEESFANPLPWHHCVLPTTPTS